MIRQFSEADIQSMHDGLRTSPDQKRGDSEFVRDQPGALNKALTVENVRSRDNPLALSMCDPIFDTPVSRGNER